MAPLTRISIDQGWEFKQTTALNNSTASSFLPVAQFPTVAHIDLLHHKLIPDPFIDANELKCLWVNDAVVDVYFNGKHILRSENMHVQRRVNVTELVKEAKGAGKLELRFRNAPAFAREEKARIGYKCNDTDVHFGGPERLFLRKAQYHWGWDWGPAINTCGPWQPIYLEIYQQRIGGLCIRQQTSEDLKLCTLNVKGTAENLVPGQKVLLNVHDPDGIQVLQRSVQVFDGQFSTTVAISNPRLWYPFLYGDQPLYSFTVQVGDYDNKCQKIGIRRLRLLQHPLKNEEGTSFVFEINTIRIFAGGSCWIPGDFMLPRMTNERYYEWLKLVKDGNQSMVRVWGGGIVESDEFYNICDREGILVWQDFLFACGNYPASKDFMEKVKWEAQQQLERVGHHGSLVIWAGNNEDYLLAERWGWELDYNNEYGPWDQTNFPAREIYEKLLPSLVEELGGDVPYWPSSPYGGSFSNDKTVGDTHVWDVWHGKLSPYQDYKIYRSRFISEFGFESAPSLRTLHKAITVPSERHSLSRTFDVHDKGPGHARRYPMYMGENFRFRMNPLRDFVYCTQFLQAEAMKYAYNCWRREFRGPGEENCAGVLVWQLNDIWPCSSWALVDSNLHRKPAYYITKRALAHTVIGMERTVTKEPPYITTGYLAEKGAVQIWAVNGTLQTVEATLELKAFDIVSGSEIALVEDVQLRRTKLAPNQTTEIGTMDIPNADQTVVVAYLKDATSAQIARWVSWPEPMRLVQLSRDLQVTVRVAESGDKVFASANAPVKGVTLAVPVEDGDDAVFEDNFVDLVPNESIEIGVQGLHGRKVQARFLYDWEMEDDFEF